MDILEKNCIEMKMKKKYRQRILFALGMAHILLIMFVLIDMGENGFSEDSFTIDGAVCLSLLFLGLLYVFVLYGSTWRPLQTVIIDQTGVKIRWLCFEKKWEWKDAKIIRWKSGNMGIFISFTTLVHFADFRFALHDVEIPVIDDKIRALPNSNNLAYFARRDAKWYGEFEKEDVLTLFARWGLNIKRSFY